MNTYRRSDVDALSGGRTLSEWCICWLIFAFENETHLTSFAIQLSHRVSPNTVVVMAHF